MDNQTEQVISKSQSKSKIFLLIFIVLFLLLTSGLIGYSLALKQFDNQQKKLTKNIISPTPTITLIPTQSIILNNEINDWYLFKTNDLDVKLEFRIPKNWLNKYGNLVEQSYSGQKGILYCLTLTKKSIMQKIIRTVLAGSSNCNIEQFGLGGVSKDFEEGRGGTFTDTTGFTSENNKYSYQFINNPIDITPYVIERYSNPYGIEFLIVKGADNQIGEMQGVPIAGTPGSKKIGALVNLPSGRISGLAIEMNLALGDIKLFKKILSTFKLLNENKLESIKKIGYIKSITANYDNYLIKVDYVDWVNDNNSPNGYRIENPSTETIDLYTDVPGSEPKVIMQTYSYSEGGSYNFNQTISFGELVNIFNSDSLLKNVPYLIESINGNVIKITEQYLP